jgi:ElaB/YqjD/DUF883 family membrane-anchored ribosome-binding protein
MSDDESDVNLSTSAKTMASAAMDKVASDAKSLASEVQEKASETLDRERQNIGGAITDFASAVRHAGDELAEKDQSVAGRVVKQAADGLEHLSHTLSDKRPNELIDAARDFGRRNPVAFAAGAVLLGITLGRLVRSSERDGAAASESAGLTPNGPVGLDPDAVSPVFAAEGLDSAGEYATPGGSTPQAEMVLTDSALDPLAPRADVRP